MLSFLSFFYKTLFKSIPKITNLDEMYDLGRCGGLLVSCREWRWCGSVLEWFFETRWKWRDGSAGGEDEGVAAPVVGNLDCTNEKLRVHAGHSLRWSFAALDQNQ